MTKVILTGKESSEFIKLSATELLYNLPTLLKNSYSCGFLKKAQIKDAETGEGVTIYPQHAYSIVSVDTQKQFITLQNPWKEAGRKNEEGIFSISLSDFINYNASISLQ